MSMTLQVRDQQPCFKYYCRICKKGFGCGRALGGHMRAHGIEDEHGRIDGEEHAGDWEDKLGGHPPPGNKRMYALRTNPNRLKSCRICENCGKEFLSWKSFLEHGKCRVDDTASLVSSPPGSEEEDGEGRRGCGWSKGKRSRRAKVGNNEEEDLANCLVMLSAAQVDKLVAESEESCASASKEEEQRNRVGVMEPSIANRVSGDKPKGVSRGMFECKACKKVFNSHQALGGHRASHKKVKGCFAAKLDDLEEILVDENVINHVGSSLPTKSTEILPFVLASRPPLAVPSSRKSKVHECSICHRVFSTGQALGGHKRCHWVTSNSQNTSSIPMFLQFPDHSQQLHQSPNFNNSKLLDLNLPAPLDDIAGNLKDSDNPLSFEVPTAIYIKPWIGLRANVDDDNHHNHHHNNNNDNNSYTNSNNNDANNTSGLAVDDEADSKVKLAKLSDLKDMNLGGGSSPWLQVGIGSTGNGGSEP